MRRARSRLPLVTACIISSFFLPSIASAAPSVEVDLHAAFAAPPLLLELLESAAAENSSCYFPLLDSLAEGRIGDLLDKNDKQLYESVRNLLQEEEYLSDPVALASWDFTVATRATAPRIEAQFQFWRTTVNQTADAGGQKGQIKHALDVWCGEKLSQIEDDCEERDAADRRHHNHHTSRHLDFDREHGKSPSLTLYADIMSPDFPKAFKRWHGKHKHSSFRFRYKPEDGANRQPLDVNGYGVELALKRTDYIVIDDREAEESIKTQKTDDKMQQAEVNLNEQDVQNVKPLSSSELRNLGLGTASFIMRSDDPLGTLLKVSQDFPKYSSALAQNNATTAFIREHNSNRKALLQPGINVIWLNGQQLSPREMDAFSLLDITRRERALLKSIQSEGLSPSEAVELLSHPALTLAQSNDEPQRYDFTDAPEGAGVIVWLNDLEKDKRYVEWPTTVSAYLQRLFPGQLPGVRRNAQTVVFFVDLSDAEDVLDVVDNLQSFVKRTVPVRFGIVPVVKDTSISAHAKIFYHLHEAYGLSALMKYLRGCLDQKSFTEPNAKIFEGVAQRSKLRKGQGNLSLDEILNSDSLKSRVEQAHEYGKRLASTDLRPPIFTNGVPIARRDSWMQDLSQRLSEDLRTIQRAVFEDNITEHTSIPSIFLNGSSLHRDPLLVPEDEKNITVLDLAHVYRHDATLLKRLRLSNGHLEPQTTSLIVVGDFNLEQGVEMVLAAAEFGFNQADVDVRLVHQPANDNPEKSTVNPSTVSKIQERVEQAMPGLTAPEKIKIEESLGEALASQAPKVDGELASMTGIMPGNHGVILNGRVVGPLAKNRRLSARDMEILYAYERKKRFDPAATAIQELNLNHKLNSELSTAKIATILALSTMSDGQEGIFERPAGPRLDVHNYWNSTETCITVGTRDTAPLHFVAVVDPSSEVAQQWIPILEVLSRIEGVYLQLFLNPREKLQELPNKRFYRHVLAAAPKFADGGALMSQSAHFAGIPRDALLTMNLDVPPSWFVAPKESIYDLDNIKLSSLGEKSSVEASYELENILIEGHSRDVTVGNPPRGAQLILGTEADPDVAGTIVMANLGYFQFKANPGVYQLKLKDGASDRIFSLESAGTSGFGARPGDQNTQISLAGFKGATVFPRLSRKPGMEYEDVLETEAASTTSNFITKGAAVADDLLAKAGLPNVQSQEYIAKFAHWGQGILGMNTANETTITTRKHADINIFSVASGHLYERMLNIMMLSVMRHTNHTVKFWFIEQFLSPSFKTFLPTIAAEYGFDYEMVAYKWPHWLRAQQEKQRIIWGYKILFLDVLFPLDLDKVIFVDADQIVRTDMYNLVQHDLEGAPYGFTPMCDSRTEMEGFRFWKQGYWENFLQGKPYHISALYVVDLKRFRQIAAGDRLRQQYHSLSADPGSLSNLDQDLPNHMQHMLPIHSLPQEWLWCETWCSDESLKDARTIDLCNNPQTKEPKLDRARRQVPEWTVYDNEIAELAKTRKGEQQSVGGVIGGENKKANEQQHDPNIKDEL